MNEQAEFPIVGSATRPKFQHPASEIRICKNKAQACRVSLMHSGLTQETVAGRLHKTAGYISMLLSGKRDWPDKLLKKFMHVTGSLAPLQWDAMQEGVELYVDTVAQRKAQLIAELNEIDRVAA